MTNLPTITVKTNLGAAMKKVVDTVASNVSSPSTDFAVDQTSRGTKIKLKPRAKFASEATAYRGEWNDDEFYSVNDMVRVKPNTTYTSSAGETINATAGVWMCVCDSPGNAYSTAIKAAGLIQPEYQQWLRQTNPPVDYFPKWPEPSNLASLSEDPNAAVGRYWELVSLLPTEMTMCVNETVYTYYVDGFQSGSVSA